MAALTLSFAFLGAHPRAAAHRASPQVTTVIGSVSPSLPGGVEVSVVAGVATQLVIENHTDEEVLVLGAAGDPFLRIGPEGVFGNVNSPDWYRSGTPEGGLPVPEHARSGASPDWRHVSDRPMWGWFDHRLHPTTVAVPPEAAEAEEPVRLASWSVPLRYGEQDVVVEGHLEYRPVFGSVLSRLLSPEQPVDGLRVALTQGRVPGVFLSNETGREVTVLGPEDEPFLRFTADGVLANVHSPAFADDLRASGQGLAATATVDPDAEPEWIEVASQPRHAWLENRARYPEEQPPAEVTERGETTVLMEWSVPLLVGERRITLEGETLWVPTEEALDMVGASDPQHGDPPGALDLSVLMLGIGVVMLGWWAWRRRSRVADERSPRDHDPDRRSAPAVASRAEDRGRR